MARQLVRGGMPLEIPTAEEIGTTMDARLRAFSEHQAAIEEARQREYARGLKRMEFYQIQAGATSFWSGPLVDEGYVWSLRLVGVTLATAGTCTIYRATQSGQTRRPIFNNSSSTLTPVATYSSDAVRVRHSDGLYVTSAVNITALWMCAWQVPSEREYEFA